MRVRFKTLLLLVSPLLLVVAVAYIQSGTAGRHIMSVTSAKPHVLMAMARVNGQ